MTSFSNSQSSLIMLSGEGDLTQTSNILVYVATWLGDLRKVKIWYRLLQFKYVCPFAGMHVLAAGNGAVTSEERYEHSPIDSLIYQKSGSHS